MSQDIVFGGIQVSGVDTVWPTVKFDRIAVDSYGRLLFASVIADAGIVKGIRALLNCDKRVVIACDGVKVKRASADEWNARKPGTISKTDGGYRTLVHRLEFGQAHAFYVSQVKGFMAALTDEHLWALLNTTQYSTPILPEWIGYLRTELAKRSLLSEAECHRCSCATLTATTADLDLIVSDGIAGGFIAIPSKRHA